MRSPSDTVTLGVLDVLRGTLCSNECALDSLSAKPAVAGNSGSCVLT